MEYQSEEKKIAYLKTNIEADVYRTGEKGYRAAAHLTDGTFLPCVLFREPKAEVESLIRGYDLAKAGRIHYHGVDSPELNFQKEVRRSILNGCRVNFHDIARLEPSPFAFPPGILQQIAGETTMGWTEFVALMHDGKHFRFGARNFDFKFFQMPEGYRAADIKEIINHAYMLKTGELRQLQRWFLNDPPDYADAIPLHSPRLFFECFVDEL